MMEDTDQDTRRIRGGTWMLLAGVFVATVAVTIFIGSRGESSTTPTFADLGDMTADHPNVPTNNEAAPTFALPASDGTVFDLAAHVASDGRPVVLNLWASWCGPCRAEMPDIDTSSQQHPEVAFVGVSVQDDADKAKAFADEIGVSYTLVHDDGTVDRAYPVLGLPATFFIAEDGTIVKRHFGLLTLESLEGDIADLFGS
jgi:thiol-disulfide isomerase/thioredoxin